MRFRPRDAIARRRRSTTIGPHARTFLALALLGPLAEVGRQIAVRHPEWTEQRWAREIYPTVQRAMAELASYVPFSLAESLLVFFGVWGGWWIFEALRAIGTGRRRAGEVFVTLVLHGLAFCGVLYLCFLLCWGLLHARPSARELLALDSAEPTTSEVIALLDVLVEDAGAMRSELLEDESGVARPTLEFDALAAAVTRALDEPVEEGLLLEGRVVVRRALFSPLLSALQLAGIYSPFTGEAHVNSEAPPCTLPFAMAHEAAHALGLAREDEANFAAWLACSGASETELRYSAALSALRYVFDALLLESPASVLAALNRLEPGVRRDLEAISEFWSRKGTSLARITEMTNDLYLRSQGSHSGIASYGEMVSLIVAWRR